MLEFLLMNWRWIGSAVVAAFLSFTVTSAFKDRDIERLNTSIAKDHTVQERGRADFWQSSFAQLARRKAGEKAANDAAEKRLADRAGAAERDAAAARAQLEKERHVFESGRPQLCVGSAALRLRFDEASGAADPAGDGVDLAAKARPVARAGTAAAAEASCITPDQILTGYLNLAQYARHWGEQYDALRSWSLDPLGEHGDGGNR